MYLLDIKKSKNFFPPTKSDLFSSRFFLLSQFFVHSVPEEINMSRGLLNRTAIFSNVSDLFKDEIVKIMTLVEASPGHVFTKEGEEITKFLIVETGSLVRTKASAGEGDAITLDEIGENGVTGFMHVAGRDSGVAFATITAGSEGAKVWVVGTEFDDLLRLVPMLKHTT
jgi:CRP-like cAMP-binding protein